MAPHNNHSRTTYFLSFLLWTTANLVMVAFAAESSLCTIPSPAPENLAAGKDAVQLFDFFRLSAGYFFGGEDINFVKDQNVGGRLYPVPRSFSLLPLRVDRTTDSALLHVTATLTLSGGRAKHFVVRRRRRPSVGLHSVSFYLDGYYSSASAELCMAGSGSYSAADSSMEHFPDVILKLRVPSTPSLADPFVTGRLMGSSFEAISLVAYNEGDSYKYGKDHATCPLLKPFPAARNAIQAPGVDFSCARLEEHLVTSYKLQYGGGTLALSTFSSPIPWLREARMHLSQVRCTADGAVRAYATFSNDTGMWFGVGRLQPRLVVKDSAIVAEGHWDSARGMLCFRACRVVLSAGKTSIAVQKQECGIRMSLWFPAIWTIRDRRIVAGRIWDSSHGSVENGTAGAVSASSINLDNHQSNFSDVKYKYTMVEEAKKHYFSAVLGNRRNKGNFPAANYSYRDFEFRFFIVSTNDSRSGHGDAYPVAISSVMVYGDPLEADDSLSRYVVAGTEHELLTISYDIQMLHYPQPLARSKNNTYSIEERVITAEGVYDPKTGVLCMIGCHELNGSMDCQILVTVQFASLDAKAQGHGRGVISSLRAKTDRLFFEKMEITLYGMYTEQVSEAVSRMDMERVLLVISATLSCVFTLMQILHAKRNSEASAATSITMLVVLALGYVTPLVVSSEALSLSRGTQDLPFLKNAPNEVSQVLLRAPTLLAFVLQLRLLHLAWSGRRPTTDQSKAETSSAAERKALLWICLPLYLLGGALTFILHVMHSRATPEDSLLIRIGPEPATLWEDLMSSAGLALDGFLLPQVAMNAFSDGRVRAISPWFYLGNSLVRAMPHVYDVIRTRGNVPSMSPSEVYASSRDDLFGMAWDIVVPCGSALLALLLFLQQRLGGAFCFRSQRRLGEYEMVSRSTL